MKPFLPFIAAIFSLVSCTTDVRETQLTSIPLAQKPAIPTTESACKEAGQYWTEQGLPGGNKTCAIRTTDAYKICTDTSQCQGVCLGENSLLVGSKAFGSCSEWVGHFGCYKFIEGGRVREICAD